MPAAVCQERIMLLVTRLLIFCTFGVAGISKLRDRRASQQGLVDFGVPIGLASPLSVALPLVELAVALALIPAGTVVYGAVAALILLLVFIGAMVANLARGRRPDCQCFGQIHAGPIGWTSIARNIALAAVAAFIAVAGSSDPGPDLLAWAMPLTTFERAVVVSGAVGLVMLTAQSALLARLTRQNAAILEQLAATAPLAGTDAAQAGINSVPGHSAPAVPAIALRTIGARAPDFTLPNLAGDVVTLDALRAPGLPIVLVFSDPGCASCNALLPEIGRCQREDAARLTVAVISRGSVEANVAKATEHGLTRVLLQRDREVLTAYGVQGTPSAILLTPDATFASGMAQADVSIRDLLAQPVAVVAPSTPAGDVEPGALPPAPEDFTLPNLDGRPVSLSEFRGQPTVLLFWSTSCSFCQMMLGDVRAWEQRPSSERPQMLVISSGSEEDMRVQGFVSTVVVDSRPTLGLSYGALGTPSAVLVDEDAHPVYSPAIGVPAVRLALDGLWPGVALPADARPLKYDAVEDELLSDGTLVLYHTERNQILTVNSTAALIWECCDGDHTIDAIVQEVREIFSDAPSPEGDVRQLLDRFLQDGMIAFGSSAMLEPSRLVDRVATT